MTKAEKGQTVQVHYHGTLKDGTVFDSSQDRQPLEFTLGAGQVIPGFENAVLGMAEGETTEVTIPFDQAYGPLHEELVFPVEKANLPPEPQPELGMQVQIELNDGQALDAAIVKITDDQIVLDANHPLAGEDLTFKLELVRAGS